MRDLRGGGLAGLGLALLLSACVGGVEPPRSGPGPIDRPTGRPAERPSEPVRVHPSRDTGASPNIRGIQMPARIVGAVPMLAAPVVPAIEPLNAAAAGVVPGPAVATLPIDDSQAQAALAAFVTSCPSLMRRNDSSGLTRGTDWQPACAAAASTDRRDARAFFAQWFEAAQIGDGKAFATGYYEPEIAGSLERRDGYAPIYGRPNDLIDVDLGAFSTALKGKKVRGRVDGSNLVPYFDRTAIEQGAISGRAPILAWARDPVELFFLQIQGSGRLRLPDGEILRIGYATQNGRDYTGIGALMKSRGLLQPGQTSMQGIVAWLHAHPADGQAIMRENKSFVFFRELEGAPLGALGLPVTGQVSAAADVKFVPLGAPVFLSLDRQDASGLWIAQDTGGAIKGSNRFDTFWGAGAAAEATAGGMAGRGTAYLLLPIGTVARLNAQGNGARYGGPTTQP
ncbi:membrane-bound lytic murein transglycosylase A [Sphingomonas sp. PP-CE-3A-406]|uniref:murein transglycosylase A n=1 Tax=Sphingomonas sp. PP-CE-3A-406 TaxID=2135659 RepID=UPI000EFA2D2E|nr:murein transglycosylase A [Sphingomonas sp. PP-CE-3A-406]RMB54056.1 membrane-bound lytic murein transglycosylase A [Sphingomonas sp. PP-CE-3A-406]